MTPLAEPIRRYINETGLLLEQAGLPRLAGQVLAWLQVCEEEVQALGDIVAALGISKASASTTTRFLEQIGIVERTVLSGDRRDYYRISQDAWHRFMQSRIDFMRRMRRNADQGLRVLEEEPARRRQRLMRMRQLYAFLEREMPLLLQRFEAESAENGEIEPVEAQTNGQA
jgi:DNA-binding transcriptional regulator GbsR (MarR family)